MFKLYFCNFFIIATVTIITSNISGTTATTKKDLLKKTKFPECKACKLFVDSFKRGMTKTETGKFEGGDAAWEESKLPSYSQSEIRLVEIQEHVCSDVEEGQDQCYALNEQYDADIEDWWFQHQNREPDLYKYFCVDKMKRCCPDGHYGSDCTPCPGFPENICNSKGICQGSGTRKGNGSCVCDKGYKGITCDTCADNYFQSATDETKFSCSKCHKACESKCTGSGPKDCENCAKGWINDEELGCRDLNECASHESPCSENKFCINTEGSFTCSDCDKSCASCSGNKPEECIKCADGYVKRDNLCVDAKEENRQWYIYFSRYGTYIGLCIATAIIFQRNVTLAAVVGLAVAIYISISEFFLNAPSSANLKKSDIN